MDSQTQSALQAALDEHLAALQQHQLRQQQLQWEQLFHHGTSRATSPPSAIAGFLAQQQQLLQPTSAASLYPFTEHELLRAIRQQQQHPQHQSPSMDTALSNVDMTIRSRVDEIGLVRALAGINGPPAAPPPPVQDLLAQLLAGSITPDRWAEVLQTLQLRSTLLERSQQGLVSAFLAPTQSPPDPPAAVASAVPEIPPPAEPVHKDPKDLEETLLPNLPKIRVLPPWDEGATLPCSARVCLPLATEEDANWLSERQCFIRADLLEVVRASHQDVMLRSSSKTVAYQQVGIRCRYCAHLHPTARAVRSSAYPSSIRQMYQSFTMMVRDHWAGCTGLTPNLKKRFLDYQEHKIPSSSLSREYWAHAAKKIGMIDTEYGITITEDSMQEAESLPSFGTTSDHTQAMQDDGRKPETLLHPSDQAAISPFLFFLISQVEVCYLLESERVGKRKAAPVGLAGFGCKNCIKVGRLGFCRVFPLNKRSLSHKVTDLYNHFQRCPLTPPETRRTLRTLKDEMERKTAGKGTIFGEHDRVFLDQIWTKLGRKGAQI